MTNSQPNAPARLQSALDALGDRAAQRDTPTGERSMGKAVALFNLAYDHEVTEEQGWQFMTLLKLVRGAQGAYRADDYIDQAAYSALAGEAAAVRCEPVITGFDLATGPDFTAVFAVPSASSETQISEHPGDDRARLERELLNVFGYIDSGYDYLNANRGLIYRRAPAGAVLGGKWQQLAPDSCYWFRIGGLSPNHNWEQINGATYLTYRRKSAVYTETDSPEEPGQ